MTLDQAKQKVLESVTMLWMSKNRKIDTATAAHWAIRLLESYHPECCIKALAAMEDDTDDWPTIGKVNKVIRDMLKSGAINNELQIKWAQRSMQKQHQLEGKAQKLIEETL
jgi:hypothetical protein